MVIDFHVHAKHSKKVPFSSDYFTSTVECARENGLNAFILCEHFNTFDFRPMHEELYDKYSYEGDAYIIKGIRVFSGMEVDVLGGAHVILAGHRDSILNIHRILESYSEDDTFISLAGLLDLADRQKCMKIGAHPYREKNPLAFHAIDQLARFDAFDLNASDLYKYGRTEMQEKLLALSSHTGVPIVAGSDSHYPIQLGSVKTRFVREASTVSQLVACIRTKEYLNEISPVLETRVLAAKAAKAYLKKAD